VISGPERRCCNPDVVVVLTSLSEEAVHKLCVTWLNFRPISFLAVSARPPYYAIFALFAAPIYS
jgi:hypothetical protein